VYLTHLQSCKQ